MAEPPAAPLDTTGTAAPLQPFGRRPLRTFALVVGLPTVLLYVVSAVLVMLALAMMSREMDRLEDARSLSAVHVAIASVLNGLSDSVGDESTWDEAYLNVVVHADPAWMDNTWGSTARLGTAYDTVIVTDSAGRIVYGQDNLGDISGNIVDRLPVATAMLQALDSGIAATGDATPVSSFAADGQQIVGLAAMSIHPAQPMPKTVPRHLRRILWIGRHLTPGLLQDLAVRYQAPLAGLAAAPPGDGAHLDILDAGGAVIGWLQWTPDRPGHDAFNHALLLASSVFFVIGGLLVVFLRLCRRALLRRVAQLEAGMAAVIGASAAGAGQGASPVAVAQPQAAPGSRLDGVDATRFDLAYQPRLDLAAPGMVGAEALLRWVRADGEELLQEQVSAAERESLVERTAIMVVRRASGEIAPLPGLQLALSVTAAQLAAGVFAEKLGATLGVTGLPQGRLQLLVDATRLPPVAVLRAPLRGLRARGVSICLDNFVLLPAVADYLDPALVDAVRLGPAALASLGRGPAHRQLVDAGLAAARAAGLAVSATGVDGREMAALLLRLGVTRMQGAMLAPPLTLPGLAALALAPTQPAPVRQAG